MTQSRSSRSVETTLRSDGQTAGSPHASPLRIVITSLVGCLDVFELVDDLDRAGGGDHPAEHLVGCLVGTAPRFAHRRDERQLPQHIDQLFHRAHEVATRQLLCFDDLGEALPCRPRIRNPTNVASGGRCTVKPASSSISSSS